MKLKLDDIEKRTVHKAPEGYFENLPMQIQKRIEVEKNNSPIRISLPSWSIALASSMMVIITLVWLFFGINTSAEELLAEIPESDLIAYLDQLDLDAYDLASAFPEATYDLYFENTEVLDQIDFGDESIDDILLEYNLNDEEIEI